MLRLHLLGAPAVMQAGRPLAGAAGQPRRLALLALLARAGDRGLTRDKLIGTLWSDTDGEKARRALTHALYALRRDLGNDESIEGADTLRLVSTHITSDVSEFGQSRASGKFAEAAAHYDGPFMDGFYLPDAPEFEHWQDGERAELAHEYADVLESLAHSAAAAGNHVEAVQWWRRRAAEDPLNARVTVQLMLSLDAAGNRAAALRQAQIYEALVEQELAIAPDSEVIALAVRLRSAPSATAPAITAPAAAVRAVAVEPPPEPPASAAAAPLAPSAAPAAPEPATPRLSDASTPSLIRAGHPSEPGPTPRPRRPAWRRNAIRWLPPVALAVAAVLAVALWPRSPGAPALPRVAVGHVSDYRQGGPALAGPITDLLATNLARVPGLEIVSTARLYELLNEAGTPDTSAAGLAVAARRAGASQIIEGALYRLPDGTLRLDLRRSDLNTGGVISALRVAAADVFALVDSGTAQLARGVGAPAPGGSVADVTTRSEAAARAYEEGIRLFHQGNRAGALPRFVAALAEDSLFAMAAWYAAQSTDDVAEHIARMHRAVQLAPHASERERWLILASNAAISRSPALVAFAESLATGYPSEIEGHLFLGQARIAGGDFLGAVPTLRRAIAMAAAPRSADERCPDCVAWSALAAAYHLSDSLPAALRVSREWAALRPQSATAWATVGEVLEASGQGAAALDAYRRAGELDPAGSNPMLLLAGHRIWTGDYAGAERTLRELIESATPERRGDALWLLAIALRQQGRLQAALDAARRMRANAARLPAGPRGSQPAMVAQEAHVLFELGEYRRAAALFDSVARWSLPLQEPVGVERARVWWLTHEAEALVGAGDTARARALGDTVRTLGATSQNGRDRLLHHHVRALLLRAAGDRAGAVTEFRAALFSPTLGYTRVNAELAVTLLALNRPREAIAVLQPALRGGLEGSNLYVTRTELHALLSDSWYAAGNLDSARTHWRAVAEAWAAGDAQFAARAAAARARVQ